MVEQVHKLDAEGRPRAVPDIVPAKMLYRLYVDGDLIPSRRDRAVHRGRCDPIVMPVIGA